MGIILLGEFLVLISNWPAIGMESPVNEASNTKAIGAVLYTDYLIPFQLSGMVLLVAMIGAIVLTHRRRAGVRRQSVHDQVTRDRADVIRMTNPVSGQGVEL